MLIWQAEEAYTSNLVSLLIPREKGNRNEWQTGRQNRAQEESVHYMWKLWTFIHKGIFGSAYWFEESPISAWKGYTTGR